RYPGHNMALQNINLTIPNGLFGLLGPNGAGKSTLMRTIATLQDPDSGTITFGEINVLNDRNTFRKILGYLPQHFGAYPQTSAITMLRHFAALKGIHGHYRDQEAERVLVQTNLWEVRNKAIATFSGGMKQRYGIAQALLGQPKLIIVDEPTAGLDPGERRRFQNLLTELGNDIVVLLSTHIVDDVEDICSHVAIMGQGQILQAGATNALTASLQGTLWTLRAEKSQLTELHATYRIISSRLKSGGLEVKIRASEQPVGAIPTQPTLEDVYFSTLLDHHLLIGNE
ncbi:MAG TPA: ABC transporter ATP-binding protein, partial [Cellvibrio sp.]